MGACSVQPSTGNPPLRVPPVPGNQTAERAAPTRASALQAARERGLGGAELAERVHQHPRFQNLGARGQLQRFLPSFLLPARSQLRPFPPAAVSLAHCSPPCLAPCAVDMALATSCNMTNKEISGEGMGLFRMQNSLTVVDSALGSPCCSLWPQASCPAP